MLVLKTPLHSAVCDPTGPQEQLEDQTSLQLAVRGGGGRQRHAQARGPGGLGREDWAEGVLDRGLLHLRRREGLPQCTEDR
jgi:hypothetical protein